ncbi:chorismate mutase [Candidatus Woesearchaeota archaeon]|jgi:chorismate mutase|nr:chorismate mutase [Candidatus Woesearchaeota archaeon]MBT4151123.1 chorismate mutase [Candidatus Woesearchaeota archaeon]MBT4247941.1 chorismate mutase [Candidatus Woesearchaeota archaeon]MBT4433920.1 chorismate mutase [Candidatus Woesearchaeota archaeon]MBT7332025.1 chorismate mutase [Candidatus Woesearchaeota archaeon]
MTNLIELRKEIDAINEQLMSLLEKRIEITKRVMSFKDKEGIERYDKIREQEIVGKLCNNHNLDKTFIEKIMKLIFEEAKNA